MFIWFPSLQQIRAAHWEKDEEMLLGARDSKTKSKLAAGPQEKGPKQAKPNQTDKQKNYWKTDSRSQKYKSLRSLDLGTTRPFLPAPALLTEQFVNGVLQKSGDRRETRSDAAARQQGRAGLRGRTKLSTLSLCRCHHPPKQPSSFSFT